jgi:hypothetical protein
MFPFAHKSSGGQEQGDLASDIENLLDKAFSRVGDCNRVQSLLYCVAEKIVGVCVNIRIAA